MIKVILSSYALLLMFILTFPVTSSAAISPSRQTNPEKIPDSIISLSSGFVLVVDKQYQKLYGFQKNLFFTKVFEAPCSTGKNIGGKQVAGDARTPNGIFFVTKMLRNPGPPEVYGSLAFPLDYPNLSDKRAGRNGTNIWIHGTTKALTPLQSNGCVVLRDIDLQKLTELIYFNKTPVIIQESINWIPQNQLPDDKKELESILYTWNKFFVEGDLNKLDSLYLSGAEIKGRKRDEMNNKSKLLKNLNNHFILLPQDISILRQDNSAVIMFDQILSFNNDNSFQGYYNRLILERLNNKWYIVDDLAGSQPAEEKAIATRPSPAAVTVPAPAVKITAEDQDKSSNNEAIKKMLTKWVNSWKAGDMKNYRSCYAPGFKSKGMNLNQWIEYKTDISKRYKNINIKIDNIRISAAAASANVSFTQLYSSPIMKTKGTKKLELKKIDGEWKIFRETM